MKYLLPFENIIKAHFYHNGEEILLAVKAWLNAIRPTKLNTSHRGPPNSTAPPAPLQMASQGVPEYPRNVLNSLEKLFPKLELCVKEAYPPTLHKSNKASSVAVPASGANNNHASSIRPAFTVDRVDALVINKAKSVQ